MKEDWDASDFALEIDWDKKFLDQLNELFLKVPQRHLFMTGAENSDYCAYLNNSANCYLSFLCYDSDTCLYSYDVTSSRDICDSYKIKNSELLFECAHCAGCYSLKYSDHCQGCSNSSFLSHCVGCSDCFGCCNLRNKRYFVFNKQLSKAEYEKFLEAAGMTRFSLIEKWRIRFDEFRKSQPLPPNHNSGCQNVTGDYLTNCKDCTDCFSLYDSIDCDSCFRFWGLKNCSLTATGSSELGLENISGIGIYLAVATTLCYESSNISYCKDVFYSKNCLGCVGLRRKQFAILNKEYSPEVYAELSKKILGQLEESGELGEFFPLSMSPFAYNDTLSGAMFPNTKVKALEDDAKWEEGKIDLINQRPLAEIADALEDFKEDTKTIDCRRTGRQFKIIHQEKSIYRQLKVPIPRLSPAVRMDDLLRFEPKYKLEVHNCKREAFDGRACSQNFQAAHVPGLTGQKAVCTKCYEELVD